MTKFRVSMLVCLVLLIGSQIGRAQTHEKPKHEPYDAPKYTYLPPTYAEDKVMKDEAAWYVKAFQDPVNTLQKDTQAVTNILKMNPTEAQMLANQGPEAARRAIGKSLVSKTDYDRYVEAVMELAGMTIEDKSAAVQATQLLVDTLRLQAETYPTVKEPAKKILLTRLSDTRAGVKYPAIAGLGLVGAGSKAPADALAALVKELQSNDEVIVSVTAQALEMLHDKSAIKPLMERFTSLQENVDFTFEKEETADLPAGAAVPSEEPLNQARFSIAVAVDDLAGLKLGLKSAGVPKEQVLEKYKGLSDWWEKNKGNPDFAPKP